MNTFDHHVPNAQQREQIEAVRNAYKVLGELVDGLKKSIKGDSKRYAALAFTTLEESCMWATKGIIFDQAHQNNQPKVDKGENHVQPCNAVSEEAHQSNDQSAGDGESKSE